MGLKIFVFLSLIYFINGCTFFNGHDNLKLERIPYYGNALRLDGYYYDKGETVSMFFLYRNGIILYVLTTEIENIPKIEQQIANGTLASTDFVHKDHWGIFQINENRIYFEKWEPYDGYHPAFLRSGVILNDTTFIITSTRSESKYFKSPKWNESNTIYHFKQFSPKPDSTSKFIKQ